MWIRATAKTEERTERAETGESRRLALANTAGAARRGTSLQHGSLIILLVAVCLLVLPIAAHAEPAALPLGLLAAAPAAPAYTLEALIDVPDPSPGRFLAEDPDEAIVAAVAEGTNPDLEPLKPFRKKNFDLFRTDRKVEIGNQEMVVRFRLRAKSKETVSVELRF